MPIAPLSNPAFASSATNVSRPFNFGLVGGAAEVDSLTLTFSADRGFAKPSFEGGEGAESVLPCTAEPLAVPFDRTEATVGVGEEERTLAGLRVDVGDRGMSSSSAGSASSLSVCGPAEDGLGLVDGSATSFGRD